MKMCKTGLGKIAVGGKRICVENSVFVFRWLMRYLSSTHRVTPSRRHRRGDLRRSRVTNSDSYRTNAGNTDVWL